MDNRVRLKTLNGPIVKYVFVLIFSIFVFASLLFGYQAYDRGNLPGTITSLIIAFSFISLSIYVLSDIDYDRMMLIYSICLLGVLFPTYLIQATRVNFVFIMVAIFMTVYSIISIKRNT
ncbi:hypothetical protein JCM18750_07230 [Halostagnicola bangensis]